jgi:hypothetical protein
MGRPSQSIVIVVPVADCDNSAMIELSRSGTGIQKQHIAMITASTGHMSAMSNPFPKQNRGPQQILSVSSAYDPDARPLHYDAVEWEQQERYI